MTTRVLALVGALALLLVGCRVEPATTGARGAVSTPATSTPDGRFAPGVGDGGAYLPDHARTPGATNPAVTQATIGTTICRSGFTRSIRPPVSVTTSLKTAQLDSGYAIDGVANPTAYEEDHLIPLELGGASADPRNLWPEPWQRASDHPTGFAAAGRGAQTKDRVEDSLRTRVCDGRITLAAAQQMIAGNWRAAFDRFIGGRSVTPAPIVPSTAPRGGLDPRFGTCREAKAHGYGPYYAGRDPEYAWYRDADHDGIDCE